MIKKCLNLFIGFIKVLGHSPKKVVMKKTSYRTFVSAIASFLHYHRKYVLATVTKPIYIQDHEFGTLLCQVRIVKSCEKQSKRKNDFCLHFEKMANNHNNINLVRCLSLQCLVDI